MSTGSFAQPANRARARQVAMIRIVGLSAVCGVAWGLIVGPEARKAQAHQQAIDLTEARIAEGAAEAAGTPDPIHELARLTSSARALAEFGVGTTDPQTIYNSYRKLAEECGTRVDRVEPRAHDSGSASSTVRSVVYTLDVAGTYEGVSRMIHAIQTRMGPTRVRAFRMTPAGKPGAEATAAHDWLIATIETVHVELATPQAIRDASTGARTTDEGGTQ